MKRRKLIIDCDPGVDDATALLLAFAAPDALDILGVTVVAGNTGLVQTARNARIVRQIAGRADVPVFAGCARPMVREAVDAGAFHGPSGLGTLAVFEPDAPLAEGHAVDFIVRTLRAADEAVTLAVTGPATNLALALVMDPAIAAKIDEIVMMGGARSAGGNITASAEFNIWADPEAASEVLATGCEVVMFGLDATHQVRATEARIATIEALGTAKGDAAAAMLRFSQRVERTIVGWDASPLHDPCPVAWLLKPELFELAPCRIRVETDSELTRGHTAVEFREAVAGEPLRHLWATKADADGVFGLIGEKCA